MPRIPCMIINAECGIFIEHDSERLFCYQQVSIEGDNSAWLRDCRHLDACNKDCIREIDSGSASRSGCK